MFDQAKFNEIFGAPETLYQKGMRDCFEGKAPAHNETEYLNGYQAEQDKQQLIQPGNKQL